MLDSFAKTAGGYPQVITCDHGPEFISEAFDQWAASHGVTINFIDPGKPVQNCYVESFNGRMRDECLNSHWFTDIDDARRTIKAWTKEYNEEREPARWGMTPREFARSAVEKDRRTIRPITHYDWTEIGGTVSTTCRREDARQRVSRRTVGYPFFGRVGSYAGFGYGASGAMAGEGCGCN